MKAKFTYLLLPFLIFIFFPNLAQAKLTLNEIYPAPLSGNEEWIELFNNEESIIDISDFYLEDLAKNQIKINLNSIDGLSYALVTSKNVLNNNGDTIYLKNKQGEIIDQVSYPKGINKDSSYQRCPDGSGSWFVIREKTPGEKNAACSLLTPTKPEPTNTKKPPTQTPFPSLTSTTAPVSPTAKKASPTTHASYDNIYIWEVMPYPLPNKDEWVEIYNGNNFSVFLDGWLIDDIQEAGSSPKKINLEIQPQSYAVFTLSSPIFNNSGDFVRLLDRQGNEKDSFKYQDSLQGKSFGRSSFTENFFCLQEKSPGKQNNSCYIKDSTPTPSPPKSPTATKSSPPTKTGLTTQPTKEEQEVILGLKAPERPAPTNKQDLKRKITTRLSGMSPDSASLIKGLSSSSFFISFLNFFYVLRKIIIKLKKIKN